MRLKSKPACTAAAIAPVASVVLVGVYLRTQRVS